MTTGPFLKATINDMPIGSTIERAGSEVTLKVKVQAASWVDVDQGIVWVNGQVRAVPNSADRRPISFCHKPRHRTRQLGGHRGDR